MSKFIDKFYADARKRPTYIAAGLSLELAMNIDKLMEEQNLTNTDLAEKLECSKAYVTKLLRGDANLTIKSLAKIAIALNAELKTVLIPKTKYAELVREVKAFAEYQQRLQHEVSSRQEELAWVNKLRTLKPYTDVPCNDDSYNHRTISKFVEHQNVAACAS